MRMTPPPRWWKLASCQADCWLPQAEHVKALYTDKSQNPRDLIPERDSISPQKCAKSAAKKEQDDESMVGQVIFRPSHYKSEPTPVLGSPRRLLV